jgi:hypothetical protein
MEGSDSPPRPPPAPPANDNPPPANDSPPPANDNPPAANDTTESSAVEAAESEPPSDGGQSSDNAAAGEAASDHAATAQAAADNAATSDLMEAGDAVNDNAAAPQALTEDKPAGDEGEDKDKDGDADDEDDSEDGKEKRNQQGDKDKIGEIATEAVERDPLTEGAEKGADGSSVKDVVESDGGDMAIAAQAPATDSGGQAAHELGSATAMAAELQHKVAVIIEATPASEHSPTTTATYAAEATWGVVGPAADDNVDSPSQVAANEATSPREHTWREFCDTWRTSVETIGVVVGLLTAQVETGAEAYTQRIGQPVTEVHAPLDKSSEEHGKLMHEAAETIVETNEDNPDPGDDGVDRIKQFEDLQREIKHLQRDISGLEAAARTARHSIEAARAAQAAQHAARDARLR